MVIIDQDTVFFQWFLTGLWEMVIEQDQFFENWFYGEKTFFEKEYKTEHNFLGKLLFGKLLLGWTHFLKGEYLEEHHILTKRSFGGMPLFQKQVIKWNPSFFVSGYLVRPHLFWKVFIC